ncbi:UDP-N-acetylenolpyruvoylglucosamine reductase [candidate division WOR-1 bacterium RIFOXYA12_FULL_43_27]|uniref:UDP-N-acetylenolpyruvoylglucosamine reductase n=1 Tax=candidate division WOR-1 bacterium RIFOXYC2_FULL_46_14 TaxID=1802587 RepID=A0A1F4U3Z3_UNCSA|nr:MAG: UDP-N-acetylenolpyruvoylglucosamine reductase [candidate division WOR-1 bacterium RIFOXYA12_FULL_43_27]OGC20063.1 MAG: UDP-N-acetylenolpyruvoylglucosamine reductase [candidate division WOR-1 bacterium RIFOXYB2_FULL_46_45]OGC32201.1 MAG: UDP-N-acetylenolpyruvoylglucosamine reductase [candidate division WOR-1 bacterium RIFOXYA2_FULL_46_56]OGC39601.1 MAG: UDP-N-acetylenolpyruvoylglucosamine reductase [candidate division WOR-1 bacterium RIFOXYC2_FULL_46_14]
MKLLKNRPLKKFTTFKIGGPAKLLVVPESPEELRAFLKKNRKPIFVLGGGSNVLFSDKGFDGVVVSTAKMKKLSGNIAEAGVPLARLKIPELAGIPGTIGGAVKGNAGAFGVSIGDFVEYVKCFDKKGKSFKLKPKFSYRKSNIKGIIYEVGLRINPKSGPADRFLKERKEKQPWGTPSAGSIFKNPPNDSAGRLIEACGLKGQRIGGAQVSNQHANFIVNTGSATASDVKKLIKKIQKAVKSKFGIKLETEVVSVLS